MPPPILTAKDEFASLLAKFLRKHYCTTSGMAPEKIQELRKEALRIIADDNVSLPQRGVEAAKSGR